MKKKLVKESLRIFYNSELYHTDVVKIGMKSEIQSVGNKAVR